MSLVLTPIESLDLSGVTTVAGFNTKTAARPQLFNYPYYANADNSYQGIDAGKTYAGNPSAFFTYRSSPSYNGGWYSSKDPIGTGYQSLYTRHRFELSSTFDPQVATDYFGLGLSVIFVNDASSYDSSRIMLNEGRLRMAYMQRSTNTALVDLGAASLVLGAARQLVHVVELVDGDVRTRVYVGDAADALNDLTLLLDRTDAPGDAATATLYDAESFLQNFSPSPTSDDFRMWLYTAEFGTVSEGPPPAATYVTIEEGRVTAVGTTTPIPESTSTTFYYALIEGEPVPSIGDYFSDVCGTFSSLPPTIPAGDVAPPFTPGGTPPMPGDPDYPLAEDPGEDIRAHVVPTLITWAADGPGPTTIAAVPEDLTPLPEHFHVAFDFTDVCYLRLQAEVITPASSGATLFIEYSADNGVTWQPLKPAPEPEP